MSASEKIRRKRHEQEQYLERVKQDRLDDNDRLWAAVVAIIEYLEEADNERRKPA